MLPPPRFIQIVLPFKMALIHCSQAPGHREVQTTGNISRPAASVEWVFFLARTDALPGYCNLPVKLKYKRPQFHSLHSTLQNHLPDARKQRSCYSSQVPPSLSLLFLPMFFPIGPPSAKKERSATTFPNTYRKPAEHPPTVCK